VTSLTQGRRRRPAGPLDLECGSALWYTVFVRTLSHREICGKRGRARKHLKLGAYRAWRPPSSLPPAGLPPDGRATPWVARLSLVTLIAILAIINATGVYAQLVAAHVRPQGDAASAIETQQALFPPYRNRFFALAPWARKSKRFESTFRARPRPTAIVTLSPAQICSLKRRAQSRSRSPIYRTGSVVVSHIVALGQIQPSRAILSDGALYALREEGRRMMRGRRSASCTMSSCSYLPTAL
jgi:hypothetical protein